MVVCGDLLKVHDGLHTGVESAENGGPFIPCLCPEDSAEGLFDHGGVGFEDFPVLPFGVSKAGAEGSEELGLQGAYTHVFSVGGLVEIIDSAAVQEAVLPHGHGTAGEIAGSVHGIEGDDAVLHGDVDKLAFSGVLPVNDRGEYAGDGIHGAARHVGNLEIVETRASRLPAGCPGNAGARQVVDVVAGLHREGTVLAVARDRAVDQAGIDLAKLFVADSQLVHDTGPELLHHDVIFQNQLFDGLDSGLFFQIQKDRLLVAAKPGLCAGHLCPPDDRRPVDHQIILVASADLEHFRAQIRQGHCGIGTREKRREIQNFVSV